MKTVVQLGEYPGCPVVRTLHFRFRGHGFYPWLGNKILQAAVWPNTETKKWPASFSPCRDGYRSGVQVVPLEVASGVLFV